MLSDSIACSKGGLNASLGDPAGSPSCSIACATFEERPSTSPVGGFIFEAGLFSVLFLIFLISFSCLTNFLPAESILFKTPLPCFSLNSFKMMFSTVFAFGVFSISGFSCNSETPIPKQWPSAFGRWVSSLPCCVKFEVVDIDIYLGMSRLYVFWSFN
eukprot:NODE_1347_length_1250_cov_0.327541.p2 type:complete len:158 gc:universal NODE_1347_length_1250_cov_0.327541:613-140(-)